MSHAAFRIFIVDDSAAIRARLLDMVSRMEGIAVAGEASSERDAVVAILQLRPDAVLLDLNLEYGRTGFDVMRRVLGEAPGTVFIVLTNHAESQYRDACREAGARHFLDKTQDFERVPGLLTELAFQPH